MASSIMHPVRLPGRAPWLLFLGLSMAACASDAPLPIDSFVANSRPSYSQPRERLYNQPYRHRQPPIDSQSPRMSGDVAPTLRAPAQQTVALTAPRANIVTPGRRLQCVPYARQRSSIQIRGDAWTWWRSARNKYQRSSTPAIGAVLVLRRKGRSRGHLAFVTGVVNDREIVVDHANWLNRGRIHVNAIVRDVSRHNDWSAVRLWYTPKQILGKSVYPAYGFIYPITLASGV